MCAEAPWWRCHRRLISDLLTHRGHEVLHIVSHAEPKPHPLNPMAQAVGPALSTHRLRRSCSEPTSRAIACRARPAHFLPIEAMRTCRLPCSWRALAARCC